MEKQRSLSEAFQTLIEHAEEKYPHFESERGQTDIKVARQALRDTTELLAVAEEIVRLPFTLCQPTRKIELSKDLHERLRLIVAKANGTLMLPALNPEVRQ